MLRPATRGWVRAGAGRFAHRWPLTCYTAGAVVRVGDCYGAGLGRAARGHGGEARSCCPHATLLDGVLLHHPRGGVVLRGLSGGASVCHTGSAWLDKLTGSVRSRHGLDHVGITAEPLCPLPS